MSFFGVLFVLFPLKWSFLVGSMLGISSLIASFDPLTTYLCGAAEVAMMMYKMTPPINKANKTMATIRQKIFF